MSGTDVALCGPLRLSIDGEAREHALRGRQGRLLLAFLVLHRDRAPRRDELVEALWAADGTPPSSRALAPVLSRLRAALAPGGIEGRDELVLRLPEPVRVDVEVAASRLAEARTAAQEGRAAAAVEAAGSAVAIAGGGLLPGLDAPWLDAPRDALAGVRVEALELAAESGLALGPAALPAAQAAARAAVAANPFRESAHAALIRVLQARGNLAEAVRAFEQLRTLLRDELGTVPGPALLALHATLLDPPAPAPAAVPAAPPAAPPPPAGAADPALPPDLVEREAELAALDALLARPAAGAGGLGLLTGPAGIGKTRLLTEARARARSGGMTVLGARAGVLERDYGFGVVRQLFEALGDDEALFAGAAAPARGVLGDLAADPDAGDRSYAALHGLFRLLTRVAARGPVVLCVDDLQWSDASSLRFLAYLARRLEALPVVLLASIRTGEPSPDDTLLAELEQDPLAVVLHPRPLTGPGTAGFVRERLGEQADTAFAEACHEVTRGNPLLLAQLLSALAAEGVRPGAEQGAQVRAIGPRAVSRSVLVRLARLPGAAVAVARAVAVLGERPSPAAVAALAGAEEAVAARAIGALARADILRAEEPLGFVHPLVRDAVYGELPAAERALEHERAAALLARLGAAPEATAAQLMLTPPQGRAWAVDVLRAAARVARHRGSPESAVAFLERALREPPEAALDASVSLELGRAASFVQGPTAAAAIRRAYDQLTAPADRAQAALYLSRLLLFVGEPEATPRIAAEARRTLPPGHEDIAAALEAVELVSVFFGVLDSRELARLEAVRRGPRGTGPGARALTGLCALVVATGSGPAAEAAALAREALAGDLILEHDPGLLCFGAAMAIALADPAEGVAVLEHIAAYGARRGSALDAVGSALWSSPTLLWCGELDAAAAAADRAFDGEQLWGTRRSAEQGYTAGFRAWAELERGDLTAAWATLRQVDASTGTSDGARFWAMAQAELLLAEQRWADALAVTERLQAAAAPDTHPLWSPWRTLRARALAGAGDRAAAIALAEEELGLARRTGAAWVIGRGLRHLGALEGAAGTGHLREAVALLDDGPARLELAKALAALDAVAPDPAVRARALGLARRCGARGLAAALQP